MPLPSASSSVSSSCAPSRETHQSNMSLSSSAATALSGLLFGAALTASAVYSPATIIAQMQLRDFHMLKVFLTASASSAIIIPFLTSLGFGTSGPRPPATVKHLPPYSANALGGLLLGLGMTLTGACPGTVFPQIATGIPSGALVLLGGILGGVLWSMFRTSLKQKAQSTPQSNGLKIGTGTSTKRGGVFSPWLSTYVLFCGLAIILASVGAPSVTIATIQPVVGGLLIGAAQAGSLLLTGSTVGMSAAYEDAGICVRSWIRGARASGSQTTSLADTTAPRLTWLPTRPMWFAFGVLAGSWAFANLNLSQLAPNEPRVGRAVLERGNGEVEIGSLTAILGGCLMIFGSRLAGGCTSGHGISGMATLGPASFVTVGGIFVGGIGLAALLG